MFRMIYSKGGRRYGVEVDDPRLEGGWWTAVHMGHRMWMCREEDLLAIEQILRRSNTGPL